MKIGEIIYMKSCKAFCGPSSFEFKAKKNYKMVFLALGTVKDGDSFFVGPVLNSLGLFNNFEKQTSKDETKINSPIIKSAKNKDEAWDLQETYKGKPHGWIQWKGTNVCMDIHCTCGCLSHIDASFAYHVVCPACNQVYFCNGNIELIAIEEKPEHCTVMGLDE